MIDVLTLPNLLSVGRCASQLAQVRWNLSSDLTSGAMI